MKQWLSFLLILLMVMTPVSSALVHYSSIANSLLTEQIVLASMDLISDAAIQNPDQCHQHTKIKSICNTDASCSFHLCGHGVIATIFSFSYAYTSYRYAHLDRLIFTSRNFSPEIKPPIASLLA